MDKLKFTTFCSQKSPVFLQPIATVNLYIFADIFDKIWDFQTNFAGLQIRLLSFWYKTDNKETLVIATHGFIKKVDKVPTNEIERAVRLRDKYFNSKQKK